MWVNDQLYDRVDEQGNCAGRWVSRCPTCGAMVYERTESLAADTSAHVDRTNAMTVF
jgi:hypothetical protein